jgi:hypothetical protein
MDHGDLCRFAFNHLGNPEALARILAEGDADGVGALVVGTRNAARLEVLVDQALDCGQLFGGDAGEIAQGNVGLARPEDLGDLVRKCGGGLGPSGGRLGRGRQRCDEYGIASSLISLIAGIFLRICCLRGLYRFAVAGE